MYRQSTSQAGYLRFVPTSATRENVALRYRTIELGMELNDDFLCNPHFSGSDDLTCLQNTTSTVR